MKRDVFISYSRKNYDTVIEIKRQIDAATGADCCWFDLELIDIGTTNFLRDLVKGINSCNILLFMLSEESQKSKYALQELSFARKKGKPIVFVNINDCQMSSDFKSKYHFSDTISWNNLIQRNRLLNYLNVEETIARLDKEIGELKLIRDYNGDYGYSDLYGNLVIPCQWKDAWPMFREGLAAVADNNDKWGFIDKSGSLVISCKWSYAYPFSEGLARVMDDKGKIGYIDKKGNVIIKCKYGPSGPFVDGISTVSDVSGNGSHKWLKIDKTGKVVGEKEE